MKKILILTLFAIFLITLVSSDSFILDGDLFPDKVYTGDYKVVKQDGNETSYNVIFNKTLIRNLTSGQNRTFINISFVANAPTYTITKNITVIQTDANGTEINRTDMSESYNYSIPTEMPLGRRTRAKLDSLNIQRKLSKFPCNKNPVMFETGDQYTFSYLASRCFICQQNRLYL